MFHIIKRFDIFRCIVFSMYLDIYIQVFNKSYESKKVKTPYNLELGSILKWIDYLHILFLIDMDAYHVAEADMLDHALPHHMQRRCNILSCGYLYHGTGPGQAIPILPFGFRTGMCAFFGWEAAPFFDPFSSVPFRSVPRRKPKRKPVTQESFPTHLPPPQICPKICLLYMP